MKVSIKEGLRNLLPLFARGHVGSHSYYSRITFAKRSVSTAVQRVCRLCSVLECYAFLSFLSFMEYNIIGFPGISMGLFSEHGPCLEHDHETLRPIIVSTWMPEKVGGLAGKSLVFAETQVNFFEVTQCTNNINKKRNRIDFVGGKKMVAPE